GDAVRPAERNPGGVVGDIEGHELRLLGDAGIAGRTVEPLDERARRDLPGERMLASAGAEEEDVHGRLVVGIFQRSWCSMAGSRRKGLALPRPLLPMPTPPPP